MDDSGALAEPAAAVRPAVVGGALLASQLAASSPAYSKPPQRGDHVSSHASSSGEPMTPLHHEGPPDLPLSWAEFSSVQVTEDRPTRSLNILYDG